MNVYGGSPSKKLKQTESPMRMRQQETLIDKQAHAESSVDAKIEKLQSLLKMAKTSK